MVGVHPNTVRMYEVLGLIPTPIRKANGYRVFTDLHIDQFKLARTAFQIEVLQNGLRKRIVEVVKLSAEGRYDEAIALTSDYIHTVQTEIANCHEAVEITNALIKGSPPKNTLLYKRKEVSDYLGISMDTLRNWEMNGLIRVKRRENGYRVYDNEMVQKLKIIRSLRCSNYSLSAILRMMHALMQNDETNISQVLNTPNENEDIVSVCDKLILSLNDAERNANQIMAMLQQMKNKY